MTGGGETSTLSENKGNSMWNDLHIAKSSKLTEGNAVNISTKNKTIINHIKENIDNSEENNQCTTYDNIFEVVHYIVSECSKHLQKDFKSWHKMLG